MLLDYENGTYIVRAPRADTKRLVNEFGLDFWPAASSSDEGVFSSEQPYAAAPFWEYASGRAKAEPRLAWVAREVAASQALTGGHYDVPADQELSGYQNANLAYMLRRGGKVLVGDEMGLGKTMVAIVYANEIRAKRVLIVCPAIIRYQWLRQWAAWTTMQQFRGYAIIKGSLGVDPEADVTTVSYDLASAPGVWEALMRQRFDLLIVDEAHYLKTSGSKRTHAVFGGRLVKKDAATGRFRLVKDYGEGLAGQCEHVVELTGTPLPNRPAEAFIHARYLCHEAIDFASENAFKARFNPIETRQIRIFDKNLGMSVYRTVKDEQSGRHAELQSRLRAHFMCRHLKSEVETQLKLPMYDLVQASETSAIKAALKAESLLDIDPDTLTGQHAAVLGHIAEARRMMGLALAPQAVDYARMLLEGGVEKLVLFYWHIEVGDILEAGLHPFGVCRVDGKSTPVVKEARKDQFINDPGYRVMMGNVLSLGTGTDGLQAVSSYCLIAEPDWVPGNNEQCVQRLDRRGQSQTVNADILVAPGSIAEKVLAQALRKRRVVHNSLDRRAT